VVEVLELVVSEGGDDKKDGICAGNDGFVDLDFVNGEIFAKEGDGGEFRDFSEIAEGALEVLFVCEDGKAGCAAVDVALGLADRVEVGIDEADRRGCFFDFCY